MRGSPRRAAGRGRAATAAVPRPERARWTLERGARVLPDGAVRFSVWAPRAERVSVLLLPEGRGGPSLEHPLEPAGGGVFEGLAPGEASGADYLFRLDGKLDRPDPVSRHQPSGVHGPSRVVDPAAFRWSDGGWRGLEAPDLVVYELHVGAFTRGGSFEAAAERLPYLRELGVTAIEIMPVAEFPGGRNWGYDGAFPYAPQSTYGGPEGLRRLVDAAHAEGLAVVLDVVYNHLGPEGNVLEDYGPYFTDRYRTPWGRAVNFDGPDSDEVRRYAVDNARYWVAEFHVDGLRLDAVHAIYDFGALHILAELAAAVHELGAALGRRVQVIAESDLNDPRLVRSRERGGYGLDAQWSDDFHHAVHAALTAERGGYYLDFGGIAPVAEALREPFVYAGRYSPYRRRRHGAPAGDLPRDRFVVCLQNHDQVGNRARGDRLSTLVTPAELRLAAALLLLSPYVPLLFMGEEYGEISPFAYFVSHGDPALVEAVRDGRAREFEAFTWRGEVPDPQAVETFLRSRLAWGRAAEPGHAEVLRLYRDLLRLRREEPALRPGAPPERVVCDPEGGWIVLELCEPAGHDLLAGFNLADATREAEPAPGRRGAVGPRSRPLDRWRLVLSTDAERYGGRGAEVRQELAGGVEAPLALALPPATAVLYRREEA